MCVFLGGSEAFTAEAGEEGVEIIIIEIHTYIWHSQNIKFKSIILSQQTQTNGNPGKTKLDSFITFNS